MAAYGQAGTQQPAASASFTIPAEVNRVLIPVVVRDKDGHVVEGLKQQDFQVQDRGKPGEIVGFLTEESETALEAAQAAAGNAGGNAAEPNTAQTVPPEFVILLFDDMHASPEDLAQAKQAAKKLLDGPLLDTNYAAVFTLSGSIQTTMTRDRGKLEQALAGVQQNNLMRVDNDLCPKMDYYEAYLYDRQDPEAANDVKQQMLRCTAPSPTGLGDSTPGEELQAMANAAARSVLARGDADVAYSLARIELIAHAMRHLPGRRLLLLTSPGFFTGRPDSISLESQVIDAADQADVTISALDARGLFTANLRASDDTTTRPAGTVGTLLQGAALSSDGVMKALAAGTGGTFFNNNNDLGAGFERLTEIPNCIYVLELSLDGVKQDGIYHTLQVKVDQPGLHVQARPGYSAPKKKKR